MALYWNWNEKCGEMLMTETVKEEERTYTVNLYTGNAYLIMINEWIDEKDNTEKYNLFGFFTDKQHAKNCLGLNKKGGYTDNIYNREYAKCIKITVYKNKCAYAAEIAELFTKAFDNITIEIRTEGGEN